MDSRSEKVTSSGMWTLLKATSAPRGGASTTVDARKRKGRRSGTYVAVSPQRHEKRLQRDRGGEVQQAGERRGGLHDGVLAVRNERERRTSMKRVRSLNSPRTNTQRSEASSRATPLAAKIAGTKSARRECSSTSTDRECHWTGNCPREASSGERYSTMSVRQICDCGSGRDT